MQRDSDPVDETQLWLSSVSCNLTKHRWSSIETATLQTVPVTNIFTLPAVVAEPTKRAGCAQAARDSLLVVISSALPALPALEAVNNCIDLYIQYTIPTAPIVHQPILRASASKFFSSASTTKLFRAHDQQEDVAHMQAFALLTALCASVASVMPDSLIPYQQVLA